MTSAPEPDDTEIAELRRELWIARDAAVGAVAELGALRARLAEAEDIADQLRTELARLRAIERSRAWRAVNAVMAPLRELRGTIRPRP